MIYKNSFKKYLLGIFLLITATTLTGCNAANTLYYLFGSEKAIKKEASYATYDGENGVSLVYDSNYWEEPYMVQEDTISIVAGNSFNYTAVLLQTTDSYTDFLSQSGKELSEETKAIPYDYELQIPNVETNSIRYDCGSYQTIFSEIVFEDLTVYLTAASYSGDTSAIEALLKNVYPTGKQPEVS